MLQLLKCWLFGAHSDMLVIETEKARMFCECYYCGRQTEGIKLPLGRVTIGK